MNYPGGKNGAGVFQAIINQIPPHDRYFELFLGSGAIYRHKRPARVNLGLDLDSLALSDFQQVTGAHELDPLDDNLKEGRWIRYGCALDFLERENITSRDFVYLDPPYLGEARRSPVPIYRIEMLGAAAHNRLLDLVEKTEAMVAISGYHSELYAQRAALPAV